MDMSFLNFVFKLENKVDIDLIVFVYEKFDRRCVVVM